MILYRFIASEIRHSGVQALTFILCVALSIATLTGLNSFKRDVNRSLLEDARTLHGADVVVHSHYPFTDPLQSRVADLVKDGSVQLSRAYEFYTVARTADGQSLLVNIKAVDTVYPFYGTVSVASSRRFQQALQPGTAIVAPELLVRLGLTTGDELLIGESVLKIADSIQYDSSRPISFFAFGPRVYIPVENLDAVNLLGSSSRSEYDILLKTTDPARTEQLAKELQEIAVVGQERVATARTARSGVKRFFDNMTFFLSFISIFTLLLSGIGMQSSLSAILRTKQKGMAIAKTVGATNRFLFLHYLVMVALLGLFGAMAGILAGQGIKLFFPLLFKGMMVSNSGLQLSPADIAEGLALGAIVVLLFTILPLYRISVIRPMAVFRHEDFGKDKGAVVYWARTIGFFFLVLLVIRQLEDVKNGIYFMLGFLGLIGIISVLASLLLRWLRSASIARLSLRQAIRSLYRPGNATHSIVVTLASALTVLLTIYLLQYNLSVSFVRSYPTGAPNLFCLDIQKDQKDAFLSLVGGEAELHPVIRARLISINGEPINYERERKRKSDSLAREFNLTYRSHLLGDEVITKGTTLFSPERVEPGLVEVSVLDTIADIGDIGLDDRLVFNIQGIMLEAKVTSIRSRTKSKLYPFFYFVFTEDTLSSAPQTFFAALHVDKEKIPEMIHRIVSEMGNISTINAADTAVRVGEMLRRMAGIIGFFAFFSILAGCLILVSAIYATRLERIRESAYYKVLGGKAGFVLAILVYENMILALLSVLIAGFAANISAWLLCHFVFEISYRTDIVGPLLLAICTLLVIVGVGLASSVGIIRQKPVRYLREQNGG